MSTYTSSSVSWPVRQSLTEQKQKSGLFTCSAEFISPVDDTNIPTAIETSIGSVNIFPNPNITIGSTDGFKKINATGYGVWDETRSEEVFGVAAYDMQVTYNVGVTAEDGSVERQDFYTSHRIIVETGWIKKIGDSTPTLSRSLSIIHTGEIIVTISNRKLNLYRTARVSPQLNQSLAMVRKNIYGQIIETEAAYQILPTASVLI